MKQTFQRRIVAFSGKRGSGKDTCADVLVRDHNFVKLGLADPIKFYLTDLLGLAPDDVRLWGPSEHREEMIPHVGRSAREMLQTLGTEWGRACVHPDVWIAHLLRRARNAGHHHVVVTDVRFPNEVARLRESDAMLVRVVRPASEKHDVASEHASETSLDAVPDSYFDLVIVNDGSLDRLASLVREFFTR